MLVFDPKSYRYTSRRRDQAALEQRIREICETRVRYGYRQVHVMLRREGWLINMKKVRRIYNALGVQLRNKTPKRQVKAKLRHDRREACGSHDVWAMDFVHDQLASGHKIRLLTVVDTFSRYSPVVDPRVQLPGRGRRQHTGTSLRKDRIPQDDPCGPGNRVRISRPRSLGLYQQCHPRLLTVRKADRQRVYRSVQWAVQGGMPEPALVHGTRRCERKAGGLAWRLQHGKIAPRDR